LLLSFGSFAGLCSLLFNALLDRKSLTRKLAVVRAEQIRVNAPIVLNRPKPPYRYFQLYSLAQSLAKH